MRASYRAAISWLAFNDDCSWAYEATAEPSPAVTACLVADLFGEDIDQVRRDIVSEQCRQGLCHEG